MRRPATPGHDRGENRPASAEIAKLPTYSVEIEQPLRGASPIALTACPQTHEDRLYGKKTFGFQGVMSGYNSHGKTWSLRTKWVILKGKENSSQRKYRASLRLPQCHAFVAILSTANSAQALSLV